MKLSSKIAYIIIGIILAVALPVIAYNVSVPQATQKGDIPTGLTTGNYQLLHPGSDGLVLTSSSTSANGLAWQTASTTGGSGITSLNGLVNGTQTFATTSAGTVFTIGSSGSTHTFTFPANLLSTSSADSTYVGFTYASSTFPSFTYASSSYATLWNLKAGTNITISTSSGVTINATSPTIVGGGTATGPAFTFATSTDTNLLLQIVCATSTCTFTPSWTGTLAAARLNSNVVQGITNDTNVTGSISAQNLTLGWTGTLADGRIASAATWNAKVGLAYASSSYFTLWNTQAGSNIVITTTTNPTIAVTATPSFTTLTVTGQSTLATASSTGLTVTGGSYLQNASLSGTLNVTGQTTLATASATAVSISGNLYTNIASGNCVQAGAGGLLTSAGAACGSGGGGSISTSTTAQIGKVAIWTGLATLGNGALLDNGTVVGINATSSTVTFNLQGDSNVTPLVVASSTGAVLLQVHRNGSLTVGTTTPTSTLYVQGTSTLPTLTLLTVASSTGSSLFNVLANGNVGIGTSTPSSLFTVVNTASTTQPAIVQVGGTGRLGCLALYDTGASGYVYLKFVSGVMTTSTSASICQ